MEARIKFASEKFGATGERWIGNSGQMKLKRKLGGNWLRPKKVNAKTNKVRIKAHRDRIKSR